jgi:ArsR family transcriptional regulator
MNSAEFLDLLGNANRRRILRLLAQKPCYVTEISEFLGVSPKAVIDHLQKLEDAGLVESRTDDRRRKYFSIARHVRLEVTVSPYEFGTKSAYPASSRLDVTTCRHLSIELASGAAVDLGADTDVSSLAKTLSDLESLERELSLAQRWVQGRMTTLKERLAETVEQGDPRLVSELLLAVADGKGDLERLSQAVEAPPEVVEATLEQLAKEGAVRREGQTWELVVEDE